VDRTGQASGVHEHGDLVSAAQLHTTIQLEKRNDIKLSANIDTNNTYSLYSPPEQVKEEN